MEKMQRQNKVETNMDENPMKLNLHLMVERVFGMKTVCIYGQNIEKNIGLCWRMRKLRIWQ